MNKDTESRRPTPVSPREREVLTLAAEGLVDKEIAERMKVSFTSVRTYWERLRKKLNASNRAHAIALGMPHSDVEKAGDELAGFIVRNIDDEAIFICSKDCHLKSWNKGVQSLFGYTEDEWIGKNVDIFFLQVEKKDAQRELSDAAKAGTSVNDRWHLRRDGSRFWGTNTVIAISDKPGEAFAKIVREKTPPDKKA